MRPNDSYAIFLRLTMPQSPHSDRCDLLREAHSRTDSLDLTPALVVPFAMLG